MSEPGSLVWIARHELRLAWRDWLGLFAWGRQGRVWAVGAVIVAVAGAMHLLAYHLVGPSAPSGIDPERTTLILVTGCALLAWSLTLSQAMEMVTRAFYARVAEISGLPAAQKCKLIVVGVDGTKTEADSWTSSEKGRVEGAKRSGIVSVSPEKVKSVVVENAEGKTFVATNLQK